MAETSDCGGGWAERAGTGIAVSGAAGALAGTLVGLVLPVWRSRFP